MNDIQSAYNRISPYILKTPLLTSTSLNQKMGHSFSFKWEGFQKTGSFKIRGALNTLLTLKEQENLPSEVIAFSSGNHAQAVSYASSLLGVKATIYMPQNVSPIKVQGTKHYGATVVMTSTRQEAEDLCYQKQAQGAYLIPPFDHDFVIQGQGTACYEAITTQNITPTAIVAPCGGGGLLSGTYLAAKEAAPSAKVIGAEPLNANDAAQSVKTGKIVRFQDSPNTIADGAKTLAISPKTFQFLKQLDDFITIPEEDIIYWTQWISHLLKITVEPTSALSMAAAAKWLKTVTSPQHILVILSGGNIDPSSNAKIWSQNHLSSDLL